MSRHYNEDWERRKSYLIRSLFQDIPYRVLSPVPEETIESTPSSIDDRSSKSSSTPHPKESVSYEHPTPSGESSEFDTETRDDRLHGQVDRPYSPLPPLLIEKEPNKHDDPPEYYQKLLQKIRKIYNKLFVEGKNLSDGDYIMSENDSVMMEDNEAIRDDYGNDEKGKGSSDVTQSSCYSNDYSADVELSDIDDDRESSKITGSFNVFNQIDELNNEEKEVNVEEEEFNMDVIQDYFDSNNEINAEKRGERSASIEDSDYRQITTHAEVHIDGTSPTRIRPSPVYETPEIRPADITSLVSHNTEERCSSSTPIRMDTSFENITVLYQETGIDTSSTGSENQTNVTEEPNIEEPNSPSPVNETRNESSQDPRASIKEAQIQECDNTARSLILGRSQGPMEDVLESQEERTSKATSMEHSGDDVLEQTTSMRDSLHAEVGDVTQTPAMLLRFKKSGVSLGRERELAMLEEDEDPETTRSTAETENYSNDTPEIMRTPRVGSLTEFNQINITQRTSDMELTCVHETALQDITNLTSPSQHNENGKETAESTKSDGIEDILKSIIADSSSENGNILHKNDAGGRSRGFSRKRSYEEMAVQTENITWHDLRSNFFVGTTKIFKLCSCEGHVCN